MTSSSIFPDGPPYGTDSRFGTLMLADQNQNNAASAAAPIDAISSTFAILDPDYLIRCSPSINDAPYRRQMHYSLTLLQVSFRIPCAAKYPLCANNRPHSTIRVYRQDLVSADHVPPESKHLSCAMKFHKAGNANPAPINPPIITAAKMFHRHIKIPS